MSVESTPQTNPSTLSKRQAGSRIVREVFGGPFYQQGRGYYVSLEFFAITKGSLELEAKTGEPHLLPTSRQVVYCRRSHDFARRLLQGDHPEVVDTLQSPDTARALQTLFQGLERSVPGRQKAPSRWQQRHFYPYPSEMVHYDAVARGKTISLERYTYRGGGAFAHFVLRTDPDDDRKERIRQGLRNLLAPSGTALGRIANALTRMDAVGAGREEAESQFVDDGEARSADFDIDPRDTVWQARLREGVDNILARELPKFRKIEALMNWLPFCVVFHQHARALRYLGREEQPPLFVDAGVGPSPVREQAKQDLRNAMMAISEALDGRARDAQYAQLFEGSQSWRSDPRAFFTGTLYACGAINALKGSRFFSTTPKMLDTVVMAMLPEEMPFERFCTDILGAKLGFVTDARTAEFRDVSGIEIGHLEANAAHLSRRLASLGLMREYSDATRMVAVEV